jgi:uncharacterized ion transporter superfamily protein YfcC
MNEKIEKEEMQKAKKRKLLKDVQTLCKQIILVFLRAFVVWVIYPVIAEAADINPKGIAFKVALSLVLLIGVLKARYPGRKSNE